MTKFEKILELLENAGIGLKKLIELKKASGRPKDFEAIAELEAIFEEQNKL
ncbi:hypothetical protein [Leptospira andrefontaineae]|uniref:hypothetical protein n=1 Tax=Leptospira andrefontaineae TaxID=2484976 RepID=UPI00142DDECD|nr:hypothetical protein [Leptospira andrefontaineae]